MKPRKRIAKGDGKTIGFRLSAGDQEILQKRAEGLGVSCGQLARSYVLETLQSEEERAALRSATVELQQTITLLREDLALAAEAILQVTGKVTVDEAKAWVNENLRQER